MSEGILTRRYKNEYIKYGLQKGLFDIFVLNDENVLSYKASPEPYKLYFWQLYDVIGEEHLKDIITRFYKRVFEDVEEEWFRSSFVETGDLEHHITGQLLFWKDIMGGGSFYVGGEKKLNIKHKMVKEVMTKEGAKRWMFHMNAVLADTSFTQDKRIIPCIKDFLEFAMDKYGIEFDFNFYKEHYISKL